MQPAMSFGWRYKLIEKIGEGGMGVVYRAEDMLYEEPVALKRLLPSTFTQKLDKDDSNALQNHRLLMAGEFKTLASLRHPHIIAVRDYGFDDDGLPFFTMDLLENAQTLLQAAQGHSLPVQVRYLTQMLHALSYLHRRDVLHRDLKPENVLVVEEGVKLLDFGLSTLSNGVEIDQGDIVGTLAYMAPELLYENLPTAAADVYAVGMMAYEMLAGHHPFDVSNPRKLISQTLTDFADLTQIDADFPVVNVIAEMLEKEPSQRLQDATEVLRAFQKSIDSTIVIESEATRESFLKSARVVGRNAELTQLNESVKAIFMRRSAFWLLTGESGVGKSRLMDEIRIRAMVSGALVLRGQALGEARGIYHVWGPVLRWLDLLAEDESPTLSGLLPGQPEGRGTPEMSPGKVRERLLTRLLGALQAFERPVVLLFEDLHWAGSDSLNLLHELCRRAENVPLLILASAVEGDGPSVHDQLSLFNHMPLEPLSDEQIGELSRELLGGAGGGPQFLAFLSRETGGNAFVLTEVVRAIADDMGNLDSIGRQTLPSDLLNGGVRRLVERRLEQIPTNYHRLLQAAAAYGRVLDLAFLRVLAPQIDLDAWLLACSEATLLDVQDEQWRFTHDRIRIGILDLLTPQERQAVHREVAVALESYGKGADTYVMSLAYHWRLAGVAEAEESYAARAGSLSVYTGAYMEAVGYMGRAFYLAQSNPPPVTRRARQAQYRRVLAAAHLGLGEYERARALYQQNLDVGDDDRANAIDLMSLGEVYVALERFTEARDAFEHSRILFMEFQDNQGLIRVLNNLGDVAYELGDHETAASLFQQSLDLSRRVGSGWGMAGGATATDDTDDETTVAHPAQLEQRDRLLQVLQTARRENDKQAMAQTMLELGLLEQEVGRIAEAKRLISLALASFRSLEPPETSGVRRALVGMAALQMADGYYTGALGSYREALQLHTPPAEALPLFVRCAEALAKLGDDARAVELLGHVLHYPEIPDALMDTAEELLFLLQERLPPEAMAKSWESGKALSFDAALSVAQKDIS